MGAAKRQRRAKKEPAVNPALAVGLDYIERGWPIIPCRKNKQPYTEHGVSEATTNPETVRAWATRWPNCNWALNVGAAGMMVLDLDPGHDLAELEKVIGPLPKTHLRAKTPRGGRHLYYALDDGEIVPQSVSKLSPKVDVRGFQSYVLLPGGVGTADGDYVWEEQGKAHFRTDKMYEEARAGREKSEDRDNWVIEPDLPENIKAATQWLEKKAKIAVEGQNGDQLTVATGAMMISFGLSEETALETMLDSWNDRCEPPWDSDELATKVRNGYRYNTSQPGNMTAGYQQAKKKALFTVQKVELPSGWEARVGRFRFVDDEGMQHIRPPEWLIKDFIPQGGYAILYGAPGTFKTFCALDIALSIMTGGLSMPDALWNGKVVSAGPVLFAIGEGRSALVKRRHAWEKRHYHAVGTSGLVLADPVPPAGADLELWRGFAQGALDRHPGGYKLCVIDTVGRSMQGLNENAQQDASAFTQLVEYLQRALSCDGVPCAVLALHHVGHNEDSRERGSSVFGADADTRIRLERPGKSYLIKMQVVKQKDAAEWDESRAVKLEEIQLSPGVTSLAVAEPSEEEAQAAIRPRVTGETIFQRKIAVKYLFAALQSNSCAAKTWTLRGLATTSRSIADKNGELYLMPSVDTIRYTVLGCYRKGANKGRDGWGRSDEILAPFYDAPSQEWRPSRKRIPTPPGYELPSNEDTPKPITAPKKRHSRKG